MRLARVAGPDGLARLAAAWFPDSLTAALGGGERWWEEAAEALAGAGTDATVDPAGLTWLPPVDPPVVRDGLVFGEPLRRCGLEPGRQLAPGDTVELEVGGIGVLRNRLGRPEPSGWRPTPRRPQPERANARS